MNLFAGACPYTGFPLLDRLPWNSDGGLTALRMSQRLLMHAALPEMLATWMAAQSEENLEQIADQSLERTTHFKWFLGGRRSKYTVWMHEYKPPEIFARTADFAASVHNHRYGFCSRVLSGALNVSEFDVSGPDESVRLSGTRTIRQGQTMILSHDDVHRVDRVDSHTCTFLVQGPIARSFSTCYESAGGRGRRVYDLQSKLPQTIEFLGAECRNNISVSCSHATS
jgi:hypothetical protein